MADANKVKLPSEQRPLEVIRKQLSMFKPLKFFITFER